MSILKKIYDTVSKKHVMIKDNTQTMQDDLQGLKLYTKMLLEKNHPDCNILYDGFTLYSGIFNNYLRQSMATPPLSFTNEVLRGDLVKTVNTAFEQTGTVYRIQQCGVYNVSSNIGLTVEFNEGLPNGTDYTPFIDLLLYRNGELHTILSESKGLLINHINMAIGIAINRFDTQFFLSGSVPVLLQSGDEIDLRLSADFGLLSDLGSYTISNLYTYGNFGIQLTNINGFEANGPIQNYTINA